MASTMAAAQLRNLLQIFWAVPFFKMLNMSFWVATGLLNCDPTYDKCGPIHDNQGDWSQVARCQKWCSVRNCLTDLTRFSNMWIMVQNLPLGTLLMQGYNTSSRLFVAGHHGGGAAAVWEDEWKHNVTITCDYAKPHDVDWMFEFYRP